MDAGIILLIVIGSLLLGQVVAKAIFAYREQCQWETARRLKEAEVKQQELAARQEKIAATQAELYNLADHLWETGKYIPFFDTVISSNHLLRMLNKKEGESRSPFLNQPLTCANGHKYLLGEFKYIHHTDVNTVVNRVFSGMMMTGGQGSHISGVSSVPVPNTSTTHFYEFGCPLCKTRQYKMDDPSLDKHMQKCIICPQCGGFWLMDLGDCPNCNLGVKMNKLVKEQCTTVSVETLLGTFHTTKKR